MTANPAATTTSATSATSAGPAGSGPGPGTVLSVRGLSVSYGLGEGATPALQGVDLELRRGEVLGLAGESGSGKSTLVYGATRLLSPPGVVTTGTVTYTDRDGRAHDILRLPDRALRALRWRDLAMVFQGSMNSLNPVLRVERQLTDAIRAHQPGSGPGRRRERARELLAMVGIPEDRLRAYPHQLSGGMRQRVMIAMALALEPDVVIMDEPTTALDVVMQRQVLQEILRLRRELGFSVVFITHDLSLLVELADRIAIMYAGRIVELAPAADLYRTPQHPYTRGLLASFPALRGPRRAVRGIAGTPPDLRERHEGCAFAPRCPQVHQPCHHVDPPLLPVPADPGRTAACHLLDPAAEPDGTGSRPVPDGQGLR